MNRHGNRRSQAHRRPESRSSRQRKMTTVLIVCEGIETEPNYFEDLKREDVVLKELSIKVVPGHGGSRQQIVQRAVNLKHRSHVDYDEVWCVMDTERLNNVETRQDYRAALKITADHGIQMALSNPAFEVWLLAHFVRTSRTFNDCDAIIVDLNKHWNRQFQREYEKSDPRIYTRLAGLLTAGLENSRSVREQDHPNKPDIADCNSSTEVYRLISRLVPKTS